MVENFPNRRFLGPLPGSKALRSHLKSPITWWKSKKIGLAIYTSNGTRMSRLIKKPGAKKSCETDPLRYCPVKSKGVADRTIQIIKLYVLLIPFFHFKGKPSRDEHKTSFSIFTTNESASTGQMGFIRSFMSYLNRCMVPQHHRTIALLQE